MTHAEYSSPQPWILASPSPVIQVLLLSFSCHQVETHLESTFLPLSSPVLPHLPVIPTGFCLEYFFSQIPCARIPISVTAGGDPALGRDELDLAIPGR